MLLLRVILEEHPEDKWRAFEKIGERVINWCYHKKYVKGNGEIAEKYLGSHSTNPLIGLLIFTLGPREKRKNIPIRMVYVTDIEKKDDEYCFQYIQGDWKFVCPEEFDKIMLARKLHFLVEEVKDEGKFLMEIEGAMTYASGYDAIQRITMELMREGYY
jgi:hypothetical protein